MTLSKSIKLKNYTLEHSAGFYKKAMIDELKITLSNKEDPFYVRYLNKCSENNNEPINFGDWQDILCKKYQYEGHCWYQGSNKNGDDYNWISIHVPIKDKSGTIIIFFQNYYDALSIEEAVEMAMSNAANIFNGWLITNGDVQFGLEPELRFRIYK